MNLYDGTGMRIPVGGDSSTKIPWLNLSHKGAAVDAYGNSVYAFNRTQEYGMDGTELDIRMTADNVVVLSHNSDVTGTDSGGTSQTLTIISSTYAELAALTLFTINGVGYHLIRLDDLARMAFYWDWKMIQLDAKSQANTSACIVKASQIIRDNGLSGRAMYFSAGSVVSQVLANDPYAYFGVGTGTIGSEYADIPVHRVWRGVNRSALSTFVRDEHPIYVYDATASYADMIMSYQPNGIQWQADTDGRSLSETYLANVDWE